jgi:hypothetical protein
MNRVVKKADGRAMAGSSSYLYIKGRWIHFRGLDAMPEIIKY